jgi:hypothetical protein
LHPHTQHFYCIFIQMKKLSCLFALAIFSLPLFAQTDTINYAFFKDLTQYKFLKITDGKHKVAGLPENTKNIRLAVVTDAGDGYNAGDTLSCWGWDQHRKTIGFDFYQGHDVAQFHLNTNSNVMSYYRWYKYIDSKPETRKFKILKWSKTELIFLDLDNIDMNRKYYFHRTTTS